MSLHSDHWFQETPMENPPEGYSVTAKLRWADFYRKRQFEQRLEDFRALSGWEPAGKLAEELEDGEWCVPAVREEDDTFVVLAMWVETTLPSICTDAEVRITYTRVYGLDGEVREEDYSRFMPYEGSWWEWKKGMLDFAIAERDEMVRLKLLA